MLVTGAALLSGCAVSSISDEVGGQLGNETAATEATAAADPNSAPAPISPSAKTARATTVVSSQQTSVQASVAAITAVSTPGNVAYKIGPQDVLDISVFKVAELSKPAQVSEAGTINFPLIGEVPAAGKTARELEKDLTGLLGAKYLQNPQVAVVVKEFNSQRITVEGAVRKPGVFPMQGGMSLLQAVAHAQGLDQLSDNTVVVVRNSGGRRAAARFDLDNIREGTTQDPQLQAGDIVIAGTSALKEGLSFLKAFPLTSAFAFL
jgi:polysaccharide export outer membrane protein